MRFPDFGVQGRRVLLTGSGRGIGLAIAQALAAGGASVAIQDIDETVATAEADAINAAGGQAVGLGGDLADLSLPERLIEQTTAAFGGVDVLINNASIQKQAKFHEHTVEAMRRQLDVNILAATRLCQLVLPAMQERRWGRIINFSSIQAKGGNPGMPAYAMSRAAMENLTRGLGRRFARDGVTVNCVAPGWFNTFRNREQFPDDEALQNAGKHVPAGRVGRADDCNGVVALLCSAAGEYITGQTIHVDGGMSA